MFKYEIIIYWSNEDEAYIAEVPELSGCMADGATYKEVLENVTQVIAEWIETAKENGIEVPLPVAKKKFSGKFVVRADQELHSQLAQEAVKRSRSMNDLAVEFLSKGLKLTG